MALLAAVILLLSPAFSDAAWYNSNWAYRKAVTINGSQVVGGAHTDFPVLISITDTDLTAARADGFDLLFTDSDEITQLDHEIESFDNATGELVAWVKVDGLTNGSDRTLYLYYGNASAANQETPPGVWSNGYEAVYHLHDDFLDSTTNGRDAVNNGSADINGQIADGQDFVPVADLGLGNWSVSGSAITIQAWARFDDFTQNDPRMVSKAIGTSEQDHVFMLGLGGSGENHLRMRIKTGTSDTGGTETLLASSTLSADTWYLVAGTYDGANMRLLRNGTQVASTSWTGNLRQNAWEIWAGNNPNSSSTTGYSMDGKLDEIRISSTARSSDWLTTEYNNQSNPDVGGFLQSIGAEENAPVGGNTYYVRTDGNDANSGLVNNAAGAWRTITKAANNIIAGDTVLVQPGTYNEMVVPLNSGTAVNPITYRAEGAVVIDGQNTLCHAFDVDSKDYLIIDGFTITDHPDCMSEGGALYFVNSTNGQIVNCVFHDTGRDAISLRGTNGSFLIQNNLIYNIDDDGITPGGNGNHVIRNNTIFNCGVTTGGNGYAMEQADTAGNVYENNIFWHAIDTPIAGIYNYNDYIDNDASPLPGTGNFKADPLFVNAGAGDFHLSQVLSGQGSDSPAVDAGGVTAASLGLDSRTTRTDAVADAGTVDLGYHFPNGIAGTSYTISGTVFEDVNYGGGAGRGFATADAAAVASGWAAGDIGVAAANVELYEDQGGNFIKVADTAAAADGTYAFSGLTDGTYRVRVVNDSVVSNRGTNGTGSPPVAVQTFRNDPDSGGAVTGEVGGAAPSLQDAGAHSDGVDLSTITAQSVTEVAVSGADVTGVDFGYNFDVIVNTNDSGQGSLRQFLLNANELDQTNLAQAGQTAGAETSIFMIPGAADPFGRPTDPNFNGSGNGEFTILPTLELPAINDSVSLDGTNQPGFVDRPIIEITGGPGSGITLSANNSTVKGFIVNDLSAGNGMLINGNSNLITGNWIGISAAGNAAGPGNAQDGIAIYGNNNIVGGSVAADRNVISGNGDEGIDVEPGATGNIIIGNYIGTNSAGDAAIANGTGGWSGGILFDGDGNRIGGTAPGEGNLISGNIPYGIMLHSSSNQVLGNLVGTDAAGTGNLANSGAGIHMYGSNNVIGGIAANAGNTIAFSGGDGIEVANTAGIGHTISGNSIYLNGGIGIDLIDSSDLGVTANDIGDGDSGPNNLQNFPDLTEASVVNGSTTIRGSLDSAPGTAYTVEFFSSTAADPSGNGEGEVYLGSSSVTTDGIGQAAFTVHLGAVAVGHVVTATATEDASGSTSEFSAALATAAPAVKMVKRAFETDGTPINNGGNRLKGNTVKFLIYINNRYGGLTDIDVEDVLAAEYAYQAGTLKIDNTVAACAAGDGTCTAGEENAIFAAIDDNTPLGDAVDTNDGAGFDGSSTISAGAGAGNAQVDIAADSIWALMFTATLQ